MNKINRDLVLYYLENFLPIIREIDTFYSKSLTEVEPTLLKEYEFKKQCILAIDRQHRMIPRYESEILKYRFNKGVDVYKVLYKYKISRTTYFSMQRKFIDALIKDFTNIYNEVYGGNETNE